MLKYIHLNFSVCGTLRARVRVCVLAANVTSSVVPSYSYSSTFFSLLSFCIAMLEIYIYIYAHIFAFSRTYSTYSWSGALLMIK